MKRKLFFQSSLSILSLFAFCLLISSCGKEDVVIDKFDVNVEKRSTVLNCETIHSDSELEEFIALNTHIFSIAISVSDSIRADFLSQIDSNSVSSLSDSLIMSYFPDEPIGNMDERLLELDSIIFHRYFAEPFDTLIVLETLKSCDLFRRLDSIVQTRTFPDDVDDCYQVYYECIERANRLAFDNFFWTSLSSSIGLGRWGASVGGVHGAIFGVSAGILLGSVRATMTMIDEREVCDSALSNCLFIVETNGGNTGPPKP